MPPADEPPVVVRDVFPARVTAGDRTYSTARVVITRDRVLVYLDRSGPVLDEAYEPALSTVPAYNAPSSHPAHLATYGADEAPGVTVTVTRQRGCGCTSTLRGWRPWSPYRVAAHA